MFISFSRETKKFSKHRVKSSGREKKNKNFHRPKCKATSPLDFRTPSPHLTSSEKFIHMAKIVGFVCIFRPQGSGVEWEAMVTKALHFWSRLVTCLFTCWSHKLLVYGNSYFVQKTSTQNNIFADRGRRRSRMKIWNLDRFQDVVPLSCSVLSPASLGTTHLNWLLFRIKETAEAVNMRKCHNDQNADPTPTDSAKTNRKSQRRVCRAD